MRSGIPISFSLALAIVLCGCDENPQKVRAIGEAYAGSLNLNLRSEITPGSKTVATAHHGEKLEILQVKRRFVKVRTKAGAEGWTDVRQLMTTQQMDALSDFAKRAAALPSQGSATVFGVLNMHSEASRNAPSFYQIAEGTAVDVIGHRVAARNAPATPSTSPIVKPEPPKKKKRQKEVKESKGLPPPPKGAAPKPPPDWLDLSKTGHPREEAEDSIDEEQSSKKLEKANAPAPPPEPVHPEDWTLIRTKDGKAGWVLTRNLNMSIPDEVAQYAEGKRITSYFSLGTVHDDELNADKKNWLWTTRSEAPEPWEFDGFRVFFWNRKRHRYETTYIEKNVKGYFPVEAHPGPAPNFVLIIEDDDGKVYKYTYTFIAYRFYRTAKVPYTRPAEDKPMPGFIPPVAQKPEEAQRPGLKDRLKNWAKGLRGD
jgi:hypothetical protein